MRIAGQTKTTPTANQNVSGTSDTIGFFPYAWPEYDMVKPGWTVVQIPGSTVVSVDGTSHVITITGGNFTSGSFYSFTGKTGLRITGGTRLGGTPTGGGGGGGPYTATQAMENTGSNAIHISASTPWGSLVTVGATVEVDGMGSYIIISVTAPGDNISGNWMYFVAPSTDYFPGGIGLTFLI
jgi:hypothetical protein